MDRYGVAPLGAGIRPGAAVIRVGPSAGGRRVWLEFLRLLRLRGGVHRRVFSLGQVDAGAMTVTFLGILTAYFAAVGLLGWLGYRRTQTSADFIIAGRTLGAVV